MNIHGLIGAAVLFASAAVAGEAWTADFNAAKKEASERNLPILAVFSGSDWCGPCIMLKSKVFDTPEFEAYAKDKFVLVELDFPKGKSQDDATKKQNAELSARYGVTGFPTVLALTPSGDVLGGFIGGFDKFEDVRKPLDAASAARAPYEAAMKKAASSSGEEKLAALVEAYQLVPADLRGSHKSLADEIVALDEKDVSGLRAERKHAEKLSEERQACDAPLRDAAQKGPEDFLRCLDELLTRDFTAETKFNLLSMKFNTQMSTATDEKAFDDAMKTMAEMAEANPDEKGRIEQVGKILRERQERILEGNRKRAEAVKAGATQPEKA